MDDENWIPGHRAHALVAAQHGTGDDAALALAKLAAAGKLTTRCRQRSDEDYAQEAMPGDASSRVVTLLGKSAAEYSRIRKEDWAALIACIERAASDPDHIAALDYLRVDWRRWIFRFWSEDALGNLTFVKLDGIEFRRQEIEALINAPASISPSVAAARECQKWLVGQFQSDPNRGQSKSHYHAAAKAQFGQRLSGRAFDRVWAAVAPAEGRSRPGRKSKQ